MTDPLFDQASAFQDDKNYIKAIPLWEKLVQALQVKPAPETSEELYACLVSLGECYSELEDYPRAISTFERVVALGTAVQKEDLYIPLSELAWLKNETGDKERAVDLYQEALLTANEYFTYLILTHLSDIYEHVNFQKSVAYLDQALEVVAAQNLQDEIFIVIEKLVILHQSKDHFSEAILYAKRGIDLLQKTTFCAIIRIKLASVLEDSGDLENALQELDVAEQELSLWNVDEEEEEVWFQEMDILLTRGNVALKRNQLEAATSYFSTALRLSEQNDSDVLCSLRYDIGRSYLQHGHYELSEQNLLQAIALATDINHALSLKEAKVHLGILYYEMGRYQQAIEMMEAQVKEERNKGDLSSLCRTLNNLASAYRQIGDLKKAGSLYEETGQLAMQLSPSEQVLYFQNTSIINGVWGDHEAWLSFAKQALELASQYELTTLIPDLKKNVVTALYALGHYDLAIAELRELEQEPLVIQFPNKRMDIYNLQGTIYADMGELENAETYLLKAKDLVDEYGLEASAPTIYNNLGVLYLDCGEYEKAASWLHQALSMDEKLGQLTQLSTDYHNVGFLYYKQGKYKEALPFFDKAIELTEQFRQQGGSQQRLTYQDQEYNTYELLVETFLRLGQEERALQKLEYFKNRELLNKMGGEAHHSVDFAKVQNLLPSNTCVLILGNSRNDHLVGFAISQNQTSSKVISLETAFQISYPSEEKSQGFLSKREGRNKVQRINSLQMEIPTISRISHRSTEAKKLAALIHYYRHRLTRDSRLDHSRKLEIDQQIGGFLYQLLFLPFEDVLQRVDRVMLVVDDLLELIPFDTLIRPNSDYLIEQWSLQQVPSISVLKHLSEMTPSGKLHRVLALGKEKYRTSESLTKSLDQWKDLPFAKEEIKAIGKCGLEVAQLEGWELTPQWLRKYSLEKRLEEYDILHFAVHAINLPEQPDQSALVLSTNDQERSPYLLINEIEKLQIKSQLVFLSACETALGKLYSGDATASITNAFLVAGSRQIIATLWPIHDRYTMLFVREFYEQLKTYQPWEALAVAKRKCLLGELGEELRKMVYWSAFVLYGYNDQ